MAQRRPAHGRPAGIDEGCTGIDGGRNTEHLSDLYPRSAVTRRRFGVHGDTASEISSRVFGPSRFVFWPAAVRA
jgi:hypothetical protein